MVFFGTIFQLLSVPADSANINCFVFFPFLKAQFPISVGHCRQLFEEQPQTSGGVVRP